MQIRLSSEIEYDSIVNGDGLRTVIWMQGCVHNCFNCHNKETHSFTGGYLVDIEEVKQEILKSNNPVTLSGGDPFAQIKQTVELAKFCQENDINIWCYTGYYFEDLLKMGEKNPLFIEALKNIDILVDGPYVEAKRNFNLKYRGSSNQRIISCKKSVEQNKFIAHTFRKTTVKKENKSDYIFI